MFPVASAAFARRQIVDLLTSYRSRPAAMVASVSALCSAWSLPTINAATFGFLDRAAGAADVVATAGSDTITSASNPWSAADVGKTIAIAGAGVAGAALTALVLSVASAGSVRLDRSASTNQAATVGVWGYTPVASSDPALQGADGNPTAAEVVAVPGGIARSSVERLFDEINVKDFGVKGDGQTDDTAVIQAVLDANPYKIIRFPYGQYKVSQITIAGLGRIIHFDNAILVASSTTAKTSVVQLKCGLSVIRGLKVAGMQNLNYECGVHWYTNDTAAHYPGRNRIDGLFVTECRIGLVIGALPSQADPIPAQGTTQADGVATDAPLSESFIAGLKTTDCVRGVYMRQPNGKMVIMAPDLVGEDNAWSTYPDRNETCAVTVANAGSELAVIGGDIEQIQQTSGYLAQVTDGQLTLDAVCIESVCPLYIAGTGMVRMSHGINWGHNNTAVPMFEVDDGATGVLQISDTRLVLPDAFAGGAVSVMKATSTLGGSFAPAPAFRAEADGVEFMNAPSTWPTPIANGVVLRMSRSWLSTYSGATRTSLRRLHDAGDTLAAVVDSTADQVAAYPQTTSIPSGGWAWTAGGAGSQWGKSTAGLPTVEPDPVTAAVRLTTTGAITSATSPAMPIQPGKDLSMRGWMASGGGAQNVIVRLMWFKFDGATPAATASTDLIAGAESTVLGTTWRPVLLRATPPADAAKVKVFLYVELGAELQAANLTIE